MNSRPTVGIIFDTSRKGLYGHGTHLAFRGLPVETVALADSNPERIEERTAETGARRHYDDYREMLDRERPDIVVLGSRVPGDHLQPIEEAAVRGIHVLCEKPLCTTLEEADRIVELAARRHVKIAVAHLARYANIFLTLKKMLADGVIGRPLTFYGRGKEDERGGGEDMAVLGTHILDLACFLFGKPLSVSAEIYQDGRPLRPADRRPTKEPLGPVAGDDIFATLRFPAGVRGIFESRQGIFKKDGQVRMGVTVAGTEGALSMRYDEGERCLRLTRSPFPPEDEAAYERVPLTETREIPGAEPLIIKPWLPYFAINNRFAAWDLLQAVTEDRAPAASAEDARTVLEITQGIYRSGLSARRVDFPLTERAHPLEA